MTDAAERVAAGDTKGGQRTAPDGAVQPDRVDGIG